MIQFDLPQTKSSIIKVFGIGGGGGNAVNYMHTQGIDGVDFVLCNTDVKALENSAIPLKVQIGPALTSGLGAGADPSVGQKATEESIAEITNILKDNTKMVFITAGMGGGTGTGGAPIVAKVAKDLGILTVGIVTTPFSHEGRKRKQQAEDGIAKMRASVDTILVISNDKLRHAYGNLGFKEAFSKADNILATATRCITDVINSRGHVIVDFADVCTVMRDGGSAIFGNATASGENRAMEAAEKAMNSPLLNDNDIAGAKWILLNINSSEGAHEHTLDEMDMIQNFIQEKAGDNCDVILGTGYDNSLGDAIGLTIIATGFNHNETKVAFDGEKAKPEDVKIIRDLTIIDMPKTTNNTTGETPISATNPSEIVAGLLVQVAPIISQDLMPTLVVETPAAIAIPNRPAMSMRPLQIMEAAPVANVVLQKEVQAEVTTNHASFNTYISKIEPITPAPKVILDIDALPLDNLIVTPTEQPLVSTSNISFETNQKDESEMVTLDGITIARKLGSRYLTDDEIREKVNFELQKKAFDERASKLRGFNYNASSIHGSDHIEEVPAYLRNNKTYIEHTPEANENLSNYTVDSQNGEINSKNKWLHNNTTTD